ncbi:MAG: galactose-1-phosphate uridylyltransferase [Infirmifilum sp.]|uniref:galactose-1-phosphate uridylyltransferase n=1 Tax=Infirmifilum sp. TaxID=2856575 RepID=UPI003D0EF405
MRGETYNELRWNPLIGSWIIVSSKRAVRPWRQVEKCPFCPGSEETGVGWDVLVLDNRFPALRVDAVASRGSRGLYKVERAYGYSKVVVETPDHEGDLDTIPFVNLIKYLRVIADLTEKHCGDPKIEYVLPFRNKGEVIGVSLTHPHSQVYVLPFIPPRVKRELSMIKEHREKTGSCLLCDILKAEESDGERILYSNSHFTAFLPFFAMWPYEVHIYPQRHVGSLPQLDPEELQSLADAIRMVVGAYNRLFGFSLPYIMVFHQSPCRDSGEFHFHVEFYPVHRSQDKLKYPAGIEWGGWIFTYDGLPEERAGELRKAFQRALVDFETKGLKPFGKVPEK